MAESVDDQSRGSRARSFDLSYATGRPPWDIGRPQAALEELADHGHLVGRVLDVGCGTGEHALMAASRGLDATGVDAAETAVEIARGKAAERRLDARFLTWDALALAELGEEFDTVLDCGLFHVFGDSERLLFVEGLRASMPVDACYYMLCFSDREPGDGGPRRISQDEIRGTFVDGWRIDAIEPAGIETRLGQRPVNAWLASIRRTDRP